MSFENAAAKGRKEDAEAPANGRHTTDRAAPADGPVSPLSKRWLSGFCDGGMSPIRLLPRLLTLDPEGQPISRLNPNLRGWAPYYRTVVSKHTFTTIDSYLWWLTFQWAVRSHRNKPKKGVAARYYGMFNPARTDRWVSGDRDSGAYLTSQAGARYAASCSCTPTTSRSLLPDGNSGSKWSGRRSAARRSPLTSAPHGRVVPLLHG
jgi:group II intron maturase